MFRGRRARTIEGVGSSRHAGCPNPCLTRTDVTIGAEASFFFKFLQAMEWQEIAGNWVVVPSRPRAVVHFLGGAFVAAAPQLTYRSLLEFLAEEGYAVVATPFVNTFDHGAIARQVLAAFTRAMDELYDKQFKRRYLPIYGVGHSMGCKLHLLIGSLYPQERAGNLLISFNNYPAKRSIPFLEQFVQLAPTPINVEFTPSPEETNELILRNYQVRRNLLVKFKHDDIDQTRSLHDVMLQRCPDLTSLQILKGNHLTPLGQDFKWQAGEVFTPFDALGQLMRQELNRDFNQLKQTIRLWLNPFAKA